MSRADEKGFEGFRMLFLKNIYQIHKLRKKKKIVTTDRVLDQGLQKKETYNKARMLHCARYL